MASMALPGAKVGRVSFLASQLNNHCEDEQVIQAILSRPASASISPDLIDKLADDCIRRHVLLASGTSFAAGLPGGLAMAGTIPADMAQFYWHALVMAQKLAYLYGWPDLLENGEVDEQTELYLTLLVGTMLGAVVANEALAELARRFAVQTVRRLPAAGAHEDLVLSHCEASRQVDRDLCYESRICWRSVQSGSGHMRHRLSGRNSGNDAANGQAPEESTQNTEVCVS